MDMCIIKLSTRKYFVEDSNVLNVKGDIYLNPRDRAILYLNCKKIKRNKPASEVQMPLGIQFSFHVIYNLAFNLSVCRAHYCYY